MIGGLQETGQGVFNLNGIISLILAPIWLPYILGRLLVKIVNK